MRTYQVTVYETAKEFFDHFPDEDTEAYLVLDFDSDHPRFSGKGSLAYEFDECVTQDTLVEVTFARVGVRVYLT